MSWSTRMRIVDEAGSTNADLVAAAVAAPQEWPHLSVLLARRQTAGRGRAGRIWDTGAHEALTCSILLRPDVPRERWGWIPLLAGAAVVRAVRGLASARDEGPTAELASAAEGPTAELASPEREADDRAAVGDEDAPLKPDGSAADAAGAAATGTVGLKWPNDVVIQTEGEEVEGWGRLRKVGGLLAEVLPDGSGVVVGIGVNIAGDLLPVPWAATLTDAGIRTSVAVLSDVIGSELATLVEQWQAGVPPEPVVAPLCVTLNRPVLVDLPDGTTLCGIATALAADGGLVVGTEKGPRTVLAGDVRHLRSAGRHPRCASPVRTPPERITSEP